MRIEIGPNRWIASNLTMLATYLRPITVVLVMVTCLAAQQVRFEVDLHDGTHLRIRNDRAPAAPDGDAGQLKTWASAHQWSARGAPWGGR